MGRQKFFTFVHLFGLSVGIAGFLLMLGYVNYERTWDSDVPDADRVYRAWVEEVSGGRTIEYSITQMVMAPTLKQSLPDVETVARTHIVGTTVRVGNDRYDQNATISDPALFEMMGFEVIEGELETFGQRRDAAVLSRAHAQQLFGRGPYVGRNFDLLMRDGSFQPFEVTGVIEDLPQNRSVRAPCSSLSSWPRIFTANVRLGLGIWCIRKPTSS